MKIGIPKEILPGETRVAASPDSVKKFTSLNVEMLIQSGAGEAASISDDMLQEAGARIVADAATLYGEVDMVFKVGAPCCNGNGAVDELAMMKPDAVLIGLLNPLSDREQAEAYAKHGLTSFAMELIPRISRAQSMDALSSQSNITGYKAVIDAAEQFGRILPMMMTAAGTIVPARVVVMGAGVAGLQAIATAHRLGAIVSAFDVRPAVKEQVESLGGKFVEVDAEATKDAETDGGYAKEMDEEYQKKQEKVLYDTVIKQDVAICTALIPGKPAPVLITEEMVKEMGEGSVIVDLAVETGGNCPLSEFGNTVVKHGVTLIGHANVPSRLAEDASALYAKNLLNFITPLMDEESKALAIDWDDEIIKGTLVCRDGNIVHPALEGAQS